MLPRSSFLVVLLTLGCDSAGEDEGAPAAPAGAPSTASPTPGAAPAAAEDPASAPPSASPEGTTPDDAAAPKDVGETGETGETGTTSETSETSETGSPEDLVARVQALPPVDLSENAQIDAAEAENQAALAEHSKKEFVASAKGFIEAVTLDPGNVLARFNLSCALAMESEDEAAFAVLEQLASAEACPLCAAQVLKTTRDADWRKYKDDPRLEKLRARVSKSWDRPEVAAKKVQAWLDPAKKGDAPSTLQPRKKVKLASERWLGEETKQAKGSATGAEAIQRWVDTQAKEAMNGTSAEDMTEITCKKDGCCQLGSQGGIMPNTLYLNEVCFRVEDGRATVLRSLAFNEG